jgi:hypothetical protein
MTQCTSCPPRRALLTVYVLALAFLYADYNLMAPNLSRIAKDLGFVIEGCIDDDTKDDDTACVDENKRDVRLEVRLLCRSFFLEYLLHSS